MKDTAYKRLDLKDRMWIEVYRNEGKSPAEIARKLGRATTTITRELTAYESVISGYNASYAQEMRERRRKRQKKKKKLDDPETYNVIIGYIK